MQESLEATDRRVQLRAVRTLLGPCVKLYSQHFLGKGIISDAAVVGRRLFFEAIDEIEAILSLTLADAQQKITEKLGYCGDLLDVWQLCLEELEKFKRVMASQTKGILENIVQVIKRSFEHCKSSQKTSNALSMEATTKLTSLFRKTNQIQNLFCTLLERVVKFDTEVEDEVSLLAKVVRFIGEIGFIVDGLDMKSFVDSWRGFTKIALVYSENLKIHTPPCVTPHLASLADAVSAKIVSIVQDNNRNNAERRMKLQKILIKVLEKLCLSYSRHLGGDVGSAMVRLLLQFERYSPDSLEMQNIDATITNEVASNFPAIIDQLLDSVINDPAFEEAFLRHEAEHAVDNISYHFLTLALMNKITEASSLSRSMWRKFPGDILEVALANVNSVREELLVGKVRSTSLSLYDATLVAVSGIIAHVKNIDFSSLEILLLKYLLGGEFWSSLLAADVWCFVDKYGPSELCYDHLVYLMEVYEALTDRSSSFEALVLESLIARLYTISCEETRTRLTDRFETSKASVWLPLKRCISHNDKTYLSLITSTDGTDIAEAWKALNENPSVDTWRSLIKELMVTGLFLGSANVSVSDILRGIWNCISKLEELEGIQSYLLNQLSEILLDCTSTLENQDKNISTILLTITSITSISIPRFRVHVSYYLKEANDQFLSCDNNAITALAKLYCLLLKDSDPWIRQEALESFADFTSNAAYSDELVSGLVDHVANVPEISEVVSSYVSSIPKDTLEGFPSTEDYLRKLYRVCVEDLRPHDCLERGDSPSYEKRRKIGDDTTEMIAKLSQDANMILSRKAYLSEASVERLESIARKILCTIVK